MKYLIAGLGNIGQDYKNTRHNIGFEILDALAKASNISFQDSRYAYVSEYRFKGRTLVLIKPTTYMNLSGKAVNYWMKKEKLTIDKVLVINDDLALPFGSLRLRPRGGAAGHNGLISIIENLGNDGFARLRFGIGANFPVGRQSDYVLGEWDSEEKKALPERIDTAVDIIKSFSTIGLSQTMNLFNNK